MNENLHPLDSIGFIGAGRLARALAWCLARAGLPVRTVASTRAEAGQALAMHIDGCEVVPAQTVADRSTLVFITTPDAAIARVAGELCWRPGMAVVHCSGVTEVSALDSARGQGAAIGGFHPMQTFTDPAAAVASLPGSTITIEAEDPALDGLLVELAGRLGCPVNRLPPGMRGRYHAAAGFTTQFINALFAESMRLWQSWGASEQDALRAMLPMAHGTLASIEKAGIGRGMPGPVSRGDVDSVAKHVNALSGLDESIQDCYRVLCAGTVRIARDAGAIDETVAQRFDAVLHGQAGDNGHAGRSADGRTIIMDE